MIIAPKSESALFNNRDKFELVVVYDQSSISFSSNPLFGTLVQTIYERAFKKMLKRAPMILIGGMDAWKRDIGDAEIVRGGNSHTEAHRTGSDIIAQPSPMPFGSPNSNNPYLNGTASSVSTPSEQYQVWHPSPNHRPQYSLDYMSHSRYE